MFHEPWEGRAFALTLLANRAATSSNLHAFRAALERVPEREYLADYYGRWLGAAEILLVDSGLLAPGAVEARTRRLRGEDVAEPADPEPHRPTMETAGGGNLRSVDAPRAYAVGDRVVASSTARREDERQGHTRLTGYVRGRTGTVSALRPAQVLPDSAALFLGENPAARLHASTSPRDELWGQRRRGVHADHRTVRELPGERMSLPTARIPAPCAPKPSSSCSSSAGWSTRR